MGEQKRKLYLLARITELMDDESEDDSDEWLVSSYKGGNFSKSKPVRVNFYLSNVILKYNLTEFQSHFRLTKECFEALLGSVGPSLQRKGNIGRQTVSPYKQLLSVLWLLATPDSFRSVGDRFNMGKSTLSICFVRVVKSLNNISKRVIRWPTQNEMQDIQRQFCEMAGIPSVLGAIDGTYIPIKAPQVDPEVYITRKCHYAITLQAVCIPSLKFVDVFVGYPGSVSDTRIFRNSDIYKIISQNRNLYLPNEAVILGDKAYPTLHWCVPPFIDRGNLTANQKKFNKKHSQTRQTIERSFALLFGRFRRLKFLDMNKTEMIAHTVLAACILHNLCLDFNDLHADEYIREGQDVVEGNNIFDELEDLNLNLGEIRRNVLFNEVLNL